MHPPYLTLETIKPHTPHHHTHTLLYFALLYFSKHCKQYYIQVQILATVRFETEFMDTVVLHHKPQRFKTKVRRGEVVCGRVGVWCLGVCVGLVGAGIRVWVGVVWVCVCGGAGTSLQAAAFNLATLLTLLTSTWQKKTPAHTTLLLLTHTPHTPVHQHHTTARALELTH